MNRRFIALIVIVGQLLLVLAFSYLTHAAPAPALPEFSVGAAFSGGPPAAPAITAKAAILIDADSGEILYSRNANARLPMASTTKIMTAILVLESLDPKEKVKVSANAVNTIGSVAGLVKGEVLSVEDLLRALLIVSGNDAAKALAEATAGSTSAFVAKMNAKAEAMRLKNTHFENTNGLADDDHYSSAKDLATMTQYARQFPLFRRIVDARGFCLPTIPGQKPRTFPTTDKLALAHGWITGVKTGSTPAAGYCLVSSATMEGVSLIAVVLGAKDTNTRWNEARMLLQYGFRLYPPTLLVDAGQQVAELKTLDVMGQPVGLVAERPLATRLFKAEVATGVVHLTESGLTRPAPGEILGTIDFRVNGKPVGSVRLLVAKALPQPTLGKALDYWRGRSTAPLVFTPSG